MEQHSTVLETEKENPARTRFSVIIPVYNVEKYIEFCLDNVLPAISPQDEVIISLGQSTDASNEIAKKYSQQYENIRLLMQEGKGLSDARNCAMKAAKGDYLIFIDGDDYVKTEKLRQAIEMIRQDGNTYDLYAFDYYVDDQRRGRSELRAQIGTKAPFDGVENLPQIMKKRQCFWNTWRFIYRRRFLQENDLLFWANTYCEDVDFTTRCLLASPRMAFRHTPYYCYILGRSGSLMNEVTVQRVADTEKSLRTSIERLKNCDKTFAKFAIDRFQFEYALNMALIQEVSAQDRQKALSCFSDANEVLSGSSDPVVKILWVAIKLGGVKRLGNVLYRIKKRRREGIGRKTGK